MERWQNLKTTPISLLLAEGLKRGLQVSFRFLETREATVEDMGKNHYVVAACLSGESII